ncbi:MAG: 3-deoxy-D-manno-octulosonate 8-phosphate phosphatase [Saprospiraceae bacterium]|nr:3-deoxy-D-manno-octulosonate 8-phosphate phosphatase [Saprospiraceae bacterium]
MNYLNKFRNITTFVFDIDGVMSDGKILLHPDGSLLRSLSVRDGYSMRIAVNKGYRIAIISGGDTPQAIERFTSLGIEDIDMRCPDKQKSFEGLIEKYGLDPAEVLYMGDDLPDLQPMLACGLPCCPKDAVDEIRDVSVYVSPKKGGEGCVRDVIEKVLKLKGDWPGYPNLKF